MPVMLGTLLYYSSSRIKTFPYWTHCVCSNFSDGVPCKLWLTSCLLHMLYLICKQSDAASWFSFKGARSYLFGQSSSRRGSDNCMEKSLQTKRQPACECTQTLIIGTVLCYFKENSTFLGITGLTQNPHVRKNMCFSSLYIQSVSRYPDLTSSFAWSVEVIGRRSNTSKHLQHAASTRCDRAYSPHRGDDVSSGRSDTTRSCSENIS